MTVNEKLTPLFLEIEALENKKSQEIDRHAKELSRIEEGLLELNKKVKLIASHFDPQKIERGKNVVEIKGQVFPGERQKVVQDAIIQMTRGGGALHHEYFATKNYDRFIDQRSDTDYGYCPKHGIIVFSIGITRQFRQRTLLPEQVEDAVYYLKNLSKIQAAERKSI